MATFGDTGAALALGRAGLRAGLGRSVTAAGRRGAAVFTGETFLVPVLVPLVVFGAAFFADFAMIAPS